MPDLSSKHRRDLQEVLFILEEGRRRNRKLIPTYAKTNFPVVKKVPEKRTLLQREHCCKENTAAKDSRSHRAV
ncbi:MAG: hypothetical protein WCE94_08750 [Candidatus Methanoperedens sp.]